MDANNWLQLQLTKCKDGTSITQLIELFDVLTTICQSYLYNFVLFFQKFHINYVQTAFTAIDESVLII